MSRQGAKVLLVAVGVLFLAAWLHWTTKKYAPPRTSFGDPDLQGLWTNASRTLLERVQKGGKLSVDADRARKIEANFEKRMGKDFFELNIPEEIFPKPALKPGEVSPRRALLGYNTFWWDSKLPMAEMNGEYRTSWIYDPTTGRVPYTEEAYKRMRVHLVDQRKFDGPERRRLGERCLMGFGSTAGPPMLNVEYNNHYQIVQSPGYVVIVVEMNHDARIIRIGGERLPPGMYPWMGDSIGRWEGNTLVVETTNRHPSQTYIFENNHLIYLPSDGKVIEKFTRVADDEIHYHFEVQHPWAYTQTWKAEMPLKATKGPMYEFACHEGNRSMTNILAGIRYQQKKGTFKRFNQNIKEKK